MIPLCKTSIKNIRTLKSFAKMFWEGIRLEGWLW